VALQAEEMFAGGGAYERFMGRWSRRLAPLLVTVARVAAGDSVLDAGCGTGALSFAIGDIVPSARVTGVDPSAAYVRDAQARVPSDRMRFLVGDAQALEFPDASFDKTLSLVVMNFVPAPARALEEMTRVTRPSGVVAAAVWDYGQGMEMLRVFWDEAVALDEASVSRDERNMPLCRPGELETLWRAGGLRCVEELPIEIEMPFVSFDDYWLPFLGGQGPAGALAAGLTDTARSALEARLRARLLGDRHDGSFTLRARAWAVRGVVAA
jgi:SAM-dependent methyltransferase